MQQNDTRPVLVTGATGFVGSHLVERLLLKSTHQVRCLVRDPKKLRWLDGLNVDVVEGDCLDPRSLEYAVRGVSTIYHVAGLTKARCSKAYYDVNQKGTRNVLEACERWASDLRRFVHVSSLAAAGPGSEGLPVSENTIPSPVSDYGRSKLLGELEALRYRDRVSVVVLRPSAVYGPRDRDMFELFLWAKRGLTLEISGGQRYLNLCYVEDLAEAIHLAGMKDLPSGRIYHIAEERPYSWGEVRRALLDTGSVQARNVTIPYAVAYVIGLISEAGGLLTGRAPITNRQKVREAAQTYWTCDVSAARRDLGFTARHPLDEGFRQTWTWYRQHSWF